MGASCAVCVQFFLGFAGLPHDFQGFSRILGILHSPQNYFWDCTILLILMSPCDDIEITADILQLSYSNCTVTVQDLLCFSPMSPLQPHMILAITSRSSIDHLMIHPEENERLLNIKHLPQCHLKVIARHSGP